MLSAIRHHHQPMSNTVQGVPKKVLFKPGFAQFCLKTIKNHSLTAKTKFCKTTGFKVNFFGTPCSKKNPPHHHHIKIILLILQVLALPISRALWGELASSMMKIVLISMKMMKTSRFHCQCKIWWSSKLFSVLWFSSPAKLHSPTMAQVIMFGSRFPCCVLLALSWNKWKSKNR